MPNHIVSPVIIVDNCRFTHNASVLWQPLRGACYMACYYFSGY